MSIIDLGAMSASNFSALIFLHFIENGGGRERERAAVPGVLGPGPPRGGARLPGDAAGHTCPGY